jgi:Na+-transporting NADH:ubiquinone oxidoreductase subunit C
MSDIDPKRNKDSVRHTLFVALTVSFGCAVLVSTTSVLLKPRQLENRLFYGGHRNIVQLIDTLDPGLEATDIMRDLDVRLVDIASGAYLDDLDPNTFDQREALKDPELSIEIPAADDVAKLNRRAKYAVAYELRRGGYLHYVLLPISGAGMWSTVYGYLVLDSDLNTIAGATFHEHGETPGIGDKIQDPKWLAQWRGRSIYHNGNVAFEVAKRAPSAGSDYHVDAITGATITSESTGRMVRYWLGKHGFQAYVERLRGEENVR